MKKWVDPPEGYKYGFPKMHDEAKDGDIYDWLVREGYPQENIDALGKYFYLRYWPTDDCRQD